MLKPYIITEKDLIVFYNKKTILAIKLRIMNDAVSRYYSISTYDPAMGPLDLILDHGCYQNEDLFICLRECVKESDLQGIILISMLSTLEIKDRRSVLGHISKPGRTHA